MTRLVSLSLSLKWDLVLFFRWIAKEERDLGLDISVDVKEAEELRKQADELEQKFKEEVTEEDLAEKYFIYQPEPPAAEQQLLK